MINYFFLLMWHAVAVELCRTDVQVMSMGTLKGIMNVDLIVYLHLLKCIQFVVSGDLTLDLRIDCNVFLHSLCLFDYIKFQSVTFRPIRTSLMTHSSLSISPPESGPMSSNFMRTNFSVCT